MRCREAKELRVLVVDDNRDTAESLVRLLSLCGYQVMAAHTCSEGLATAARLEPHVVLCDIGLPDANGYVVASVLRQSGGTAHARLIAVTGHVAPKDRREALAAGFDAHLAKPVDPRRLLAEVESYAHGA